LTARLINVERDGRVATVTLNRPEKRNALSVELLSELEQVARAFHRDIDTRVVIIAGAGKDFSVGADLSDAATLPNEADSLLQQRRHAEQGASLIRAIVEIPQPTIAAVQGTAIGGGTCIAAACDWRFGTAKCRMGYGEVRLGINLMWQALPRCVRLIGPARAKRMVITGALIPGLELQSWGFLDEILSAETLSSRSRDFAREVASLPPVAVQMIKRSIDAVSGALDAAIMHMDADQFLLTAQSADFEEGLKAFFEKRPPQYTGN
jgi:enoyl-CoA hydratase/carnithine racemase